MQTFPLATYSDIHYDDIVNNGNNDSILTRQAKLVLNDSYYSKLYYRSLETVTHQEAVQVLIAAGCFDDMLEERVVFNTYFMSTPYPAIKRHYDEAKNNGTGQTAIIIATGSFDPLHEGHIESVVKAKEFIELHGSKVIAGIMSPSHDTYVRRKNPGGAVASSRIHDNMILLENSPMNEKGWIYHENWEATGIDASTNFTDVIAYIDGMVKANVADDVDIYYVFGSDNQEFGLAFAHDDSTLAKGICVGRPGYEMKPYMVNVIDDSTTLFYMKGENGMSSTEVRALRVIEKQATVITAGRPITLKDDIATHADWMLDFLPKNLVLSRQQNFKQTLMNTLQKSFNNITVEVHQGTVEDHRIFDISSSQLRYKESFGSITPELVAEHNHEEMSASNFLLGSSSNGGLLIDAEVPFRVPYLTPFVDMISLVGLPADDIRIFNREMWYANESFYHDTKIRVKDIPASQLYLLLQMGFDNNDYIENICNTYGKSFR